MKSIACIVTFFLLWICVCLADQQDLPKDADLIIEVLEAVPEENCPRKTKKADKVSMHYDGSLYKNGQEFDSSRKRDKPFQFTLGVGQVIQGWEQGLMDMCIGEKRKLTIPSNLAYGDRGAGGVIPGGATLLFEVELLDILSPKEDL
mmetsp:Transcript_7930/g.12245  ORF Transcript_7930/g.12245 Transcript_7930/m.12245 type:complete len:147 (+) Transcript_7930:73-513(+)